MHCFLLKVSLAGKFIYLSRIECIFFSIFPPFGKQRIKRYILNSKILSIKLKQQNYIAIFSVYNIILNLC